MSIAASVAATSAAHAARKAAKRAECKVDMPGFTDMSATIEQKQGYAECVRALYPEDDSGVFLVGIVLSVIMTVIFSCIVFDMLGSPISRWLTARKVR